MIRTAVGTGEECVLAREGQRLDGPIDNVVVDLDPTIVEEEG